MLVKKDFAKRVAKLSESTPREAIANLLSALMPRVPTQTRPRTPVAELDDTYRQEDIRKLKEEISEDVRRINERQPDPFGKIARRAKTRKPLPLGTLVYVRSSNPKKGKSADRFDNYYRVVGLTARDIVRMTSITASDIQWDIEHGFIRFE